MAEIYQQAYVTIVAACASGVWQGFLHNRGYFFNNDDSPPPIQLRCLTPKGEETSILAFPEPKGRTAEDGNPTEERGWTYQERWLSKRVLYYGFRGLTYFCRLAQVSDRCHYEYRQSIWHGDEEEKLDLSPLHSSGWHEIIEEYSQRQLFEPSRNKLNAISAVAQEQGKPQQYVAGLWRKRLESDLAWRVVRGRRDENLHSRPQPYRAPSWSWAAVDNAVSFWVHGYHQVRVSGCFGSARATTTPLSPGLPFGPIEQGAEIDVAGDVASVAWVADGRSPRSDIVTRGGFRFRAFPDTAEQAQTSSGDLAAEGDGSLQALVLIRSARFGLCGLVLQRVTASTSRRVGFFCCCVQHMAEIPSRTERFVEECCNLAVDDFQDGKVVII